MKNPQTIPRSPKKMIADMIELDPRLGPWIQAVGKFPLPVQEADFDLLCRSVIGQSISIQAAATIARRIRKELSDESKLTPAQVLKSDETELRHLGLSQTKASAMIELAEIWNRKKLHDEDLKMMSDSEIMDLLTPVRGIGPWTVKMFLIFGLRRADVFPQEDLGVRLWIQKLENWNKRPTPSQCVKKSEIWKPYRSIPTIYMWQILLIDSKKSLENSGWWSSS